MNKRREMVLSWREIEHTADAGLYIVSTDMNTLFQEAAEALYYIMFEGVQYMSGRQHRSLRIEGIDPGDLAVVWLNELIYIFETEGAVYIPEAIYVDMERFKLKSEGSMITAPVPVRQVKAATYGGLCMTLDPPALKVYLDL